MIKTRKYPLIILITVLLLIISCGHKTFSIRENEKRDDYFIIWSFSDIQPRNNAEKIHYKIAVDDTSSIFSSIDIALCAGDIVQKSEFEEIFSWYLDTRSKAPVKEWFDIAGNHEWRCIELYKKMINENLNYSIKRGNILILMMSNEQRGRKTILSDQTFNWWAKKIQDNQDKIIITVTHGALPGSGLTAGKIDRLSIENPERFQKVLKKYNMDIWISGHSHIPAWIPGTVVINSRLGGTTFIDNGAIRKDFLTSIQSRFLIFREGNKSVQLKTRNHSSEKFKSRDYTIPVKHSFQKNKIKKSHDEKTTKFSG
ncbi:MAG: metallophosphoesterase [Spirochaetota bacterium]